MMFASRFLKIIPVTLVAAIAIQQPSENSLSEHPPEKTLAFRWSLGTPALAASPKATPYKPPKRRGPRRTEGAGARGCEGPLEVAMLPLIPDGYAGLTTSGHPTLFWYMPVANEVEVVVTEMRAPAPIVSQRLATNPGIMQFTLPKDSPPLVAGRIYRWSVSMICPGFNRESARPFAQGYIERIETPPEVTQQLATISKTTSLTETLLQKADIYGAAGIWYDTLALVSSAYFANPQDPDLLEARLALLEQVGLTKVVEQEENRLAKP
jgi:hypothetical protein